MLTLTIIQHRNKVLPIHLWAGSICELKFTRFGFYSIPCKCGKVKEHPVGFTPPRPDAGWLLIETLRLTFRDNSKFVKISPKSDKK
ncbi:hypothetical protein NQ315_013789 [Exocentrus adspersus]|uniref:Uncharacterized protein n=1 Tax=Exocentrus adspersus TaxID=1586481 RepID=A0AAV8W4R3_9CUCU|nr:hypothetical protein NQ315_013789 [Exocentrus adspersus]